MFFQNSIQQNKLYNVSFINIFLLHNIFFYTYDYNWVQKYFLLSIIRLYSST